MNLSSVEYRLNENNGQDADSGIDKTPSSQPRTLESIDTEDGAVYHNPIARGSNDRI